jgi:8-oxo-dGTP pyrophosphatase MutT (NUDIX family)
MKTDVQLFHVDRLDLSFVQKHWAFAEEKKADIAAYFDALRRERPGVWNGRVLLMHHQVVREGVFQGEYLETDYASFIAWRHWDAPPAGVHDCFSAGAMVTSDNAVLLGVMGKHTANAGRIYFPAGTPDPRDIIDGKVDLAASVARELNEETGCDIAEFAVMPGWTTVVGGTLICQIQTLYSAETADALRSRILGYLAREAQPELADIRIVRGLRDFDPAMPRFVTAFLERHFTTKQSRAAGSDP